MTSERRLLTWSGRPERNNMIELIHDLELTPGIGWALWAGWYPQIRLGDEVVWQGTATTYLKAHRTARGKLQDFIADRPRCNGCGLRMPVWVDVQSLRDDGPDGTLWYCDQSCYSYIMRERF